VKSVGGRALLEASGNVTLDNVRAVAATGVDRISIGALTHSAPNADVSLEISAQERGNERVRPGGGTR
jgi:nicotinate-nucleotide pyrophosphorylase (carboxylating)